VVESWVVKGNSKEGKEPILPHGWKVAELRRLLEIKYGKGLPKNTRKPEGVPVYGSNGIIGQHDIPLTKGPAIIIGRKGTVGAVHFSEVPCWPIDTTYFIDEFQGLEPAFIVYALRTINLSSFDTSTAIPGLNRKDIYNQEIPLPSVEEQKRIVAKIEELLPRVNAVRERLIRVKEIMKRVRQSVLSAACSGGLSADWSYMQTNIETSSVSGEIQPKLRKLAREMRQSTKFFDQRNDIKDQSSNKEYCWPEQRREKLPDLPEGWIYADLEALLSRNRKGIKTGPFGTILKKHEHQAEGVPVLGIENIVNMKFVTGSKIHITRRKAEQLANYDARPGDVLISRSGTVGDVCVVPEGIGEARISTNLMRISLDPKAMLPEFFCLLFEGASVVRNQLSTLCGGSTRDFVNSRMLRSIAFPLPPPVEQLEIVRRVETLFNLADRIEKRIESELLRTEKMTQAILAKAFRGELVLTEAELNATREPTL
jgi:type I restriction enzyme S subunit